MRALGVDAERAGRESGGTLLLANEPQVVIFENFVGFLDFFTSSDWVGIRKHYYGKRSEEVIKKEIKV